MSVAKIYSRKVNRTLSFATSDALFEQLTFFEKQMNWSIFENLRTLKQKKADSLSITKEKPFHHFYARRSGKTILVRLQTSDMETEFRLPIEEV